MITETTMLEHISTITKAHAYDIVVEQVKELKAENDLLKARVNYLEGLIKEYTGKMLDQLG